MTSLRQIVANRANAEKSTGPRTEAGKQRSARNALRHGLTAETVVFPLEDPEDYRAFEEAVLAGFDPEIAAERELVLRVAALLWRLRRSASIETGLFHLAKAETAAANQKSDHATEGSRSCPEIDAPSEFAEAFEIDSAQNAIARRFLGITHGDGALERLSRYELSLCRQLRQTLLVLDALRQHRTPRPKNFRSRWLQKTSARRYGC